jgi:hypothetical protein
MTNDTQVSVGLETDQAAQNFDERNPPEERRTTANPGTGPAPPNLQDDTGVPRDLAGWGIVVGLIIATGGAAMVVLFARLPQALAALTLCVGFGIVLASFGSRATGTWGGFAVVGAGALAVVLFLLLEHFIPPAPPAFAKRGLVAGDFSKVADLRIVDEDPLYSRRDRTTGQIRFIVLDHKFKTPQIMIQVDTTEKGEGLEFFQMVGDGQAIAQKYLSSDAQVITWTFDYNRRMVKDGNDIVFKVPEALNEDLVGRGRKSSRFLEPFNLLASALAADGAANLEMLIRDLTADDPAVRRNARDSLTALGASAVAPMMTALQSSIDNYRLKTGVISTISDILRSNESIRDKVSAALSASDISLLSSSAASDKDPTVRLQATDFLYRLKDPRSVAPTLGRVKAASGENEVYNSTLILKGTIPNLPEAEQKRVGAELDASKVPRDSRSQALINSIIQTLGFK